MYDTQTDTESVARRESRRRTIAAVTALTVLSMLLLLCGLLLWPVPDSGHADGLVREFTGGGLTVTDLRAETLTETASPRKGRDVLVSFDLTSDRDMAFDAAFIGLQLDSVRIPPMDAAGSDGRVSVPDALRSGRPEPVSVIFSVPLGSMEATMTVRAGTISHAQAPQVPIDLDTTGVE